jgi:hypothetical protein
VTDKLDLWMDMKFNLNYLAARVDV